MSNCLLYIIIILLIILLIVVINCLICPRIPFNGLMKLNTWVLFWNMEHLKINVHQNKVKYFRAFNAIFAKLGSTGKPDTIVHLIKSHCLSVLLYNLEAVRLSKSNINELCFPLNRSFVKIFHVGEKENISYCQFYMQQLPVEIQLDFKQMGYLRKLAATDCMLLSHIF